MSERRHTDSVCFPLHVPIAPALPTPGIIRAESEVLKVFSGWERVECITVSSRSTAVRLLSPRCPWKSLNVFPWPLGWLDADVARSTPSPSLWSSVVSCGHPAPCLAVLWLPRSPQSHGVAPNYRSASWHPPASSPSHSLSFCLLF